MKAFRFTLESVLTLRQRQEQVAMSHYAQSLLAHQQASARLEAAQRDLDAGQQELRGRIAGGFAAAQAAQAQDYILLLEKKRQKCAAELSVAEKRKNFAMQTMLAARQQREVVDKFFERQKKRYDYERAREEQKTLDSLPQRRVSVLSWNQSEEMP
ncbi:MAG TPA: flagellar export protein FliJ [Verrucomicrobiae bacterium]|nr:flagellar export protein FliJ [Verrucomicrobiae bacterium]